MLVDQDLEWAAMQSAGQAIAEQLVEDYQEIGSLPDEFSLLALVGKGHNGGDALLAISHFMEMGYQIDLTIVMNEIDSLRPLTRRAWDEILISGCDVSVLSSEEAILHLSENDSYEVVLDGWLGLGFRPPLDQKTGQLLELVNQMDVRTRVSVDTPTGLSDEGKPAVSFIADFTYATGIVKQAMLVESNLFALGQVRYLDLGFFKDSQPVVESSVICDGSLGFLQKWRSAQSYKKTFGHVFIFAGSRDYAGALLMTAEAALRGGTGLVTAFCPASLHGHCVAALPEVMWLRWEETKEGTFALDDRFLLKKAQEHATSMVVGPGLGDSTETFLLVKEIVKTISCPIVFDASALQKGLVEVLTKRPSHFARPVLTPHLGELKSLFGTKEFNYSANQLKQWAKDTEVWLLAKGSHSVLTNGDERCYFIDGHPVLARGGSGDILAGLLASRLAVCGETKIEPLAEGLSWHGNAARKLARAKGTQAVRIRELFDYL